MEENKEQKEQKEHPINFVLTDDELITNTFFENDTLFALTNKGHIIKSALLDGNWVNISPNRKGNCPKCKSIEVKKRKLQWGDVITSSSRSRVETDFLHSIEYDYFYKVKVKTEHMEYTCKTCGHIHRENI